LLLPPKTRIIGEVDLDNCSAVSDSHEVVRNNSEGVRNNPEGIRIRREAAFSDSQIL
jgi:hypothetical protein